ncbi:neutral zinc metallopeptidase [Niveibacterium sp. 24ML]|uniref:KPN_02809 family neutral zinc metallopeptidase n=1 Tax=Niveibacterium sp. 24ML TaxID=2985512 RepID=UPI00226DF316|nr:neutral zinc metallopeptidase [Niveibacterium sp. 24ML]MCX9156897.1 neutral zinc metallopeptidase [Niveibacterium sp. 24ML]
MRFENGRESDNIEDRRGGGGGMAFGGRSIGVGTVVLALVAWYFGIDPSLVLNQGAMAPAATQQQGPARPVTETASEAQARKLVAMVLGDTEVTWGKLFEAAGREYPQPKLVLFRGQTQTACGRGEAAMGPFYCPGDEKVYIDLAFYDELARRFRAPGDFAQAYVIAHEVGHHVQHVLGISDKMRQAQQGRSEAQKNALLVRLELQADCFAGLWAKQAVASGNLTLEPGDVEEALTAASAIGDDTLQKQARGVVVPESFTHGSSDQRVRWFSRGLEQGDVRACDTFKAREL